jgi:hypothetical protein
MKKFANLFQTLNLEKYKNNGENFQPPFFLPWKHGVASINLKVSFNSKY